MQRPCLRSFVSPVYGSCGRARGILLFLFCFINTAGFAAVTVTTSSAGTNICSNKAVTGSAPGFTSLGTIMISEGSNADFNGAAGGITNTIVLVPPTGWQFGTTSPTFTFTSGSNVTAVTGSVTSSSLTINITANNTNGGDQVFISGLQVQATSTTSAPGNIYPTSVTGVTGISTGTSGTNFTSLSLTSPLTPSVSIMASPAGAVCPGANVTFTPSPVNGGSSPVYQWYVNGSSIITGSTYNSSALANGNIVSCTMIPGLSCLTSSSATSNTIIMTVNAAPAAITGTAITCPGSSTSLGSATTGGTWSSGAPSVATVNSSGVVTGALAGSAKISYAAGGCATVRTVYVNAIPSAPSLSPTSSVICSGGVVAITAAGAPLPSSILSQNFNSGIAPWTVDTAGSVGLLSGAEWKNCGDGYINEQGIYHSPDNTAFAMSNSDTSGSASYTWSKLISPGFSLAGYSSATLSFQHAYEHWLAGDYNVDLEISTNGGASWFTLRSYTGSDVGMKTAFVADTISLNAYLGYSSVKVRFNYYCHWGYYWAVDNVMITGISSIAYPAWTPSATLYTDPALTMPYTPGSLTSVVYASPTSVGSTSVVTYTATASIPGCSSAATSVVTVNPLPGTITGALNTCTSSTTSLANIVGGGTWSSTNTSVASINATGAATGLTPGTSTISYSTGVCAATAVLTVNNTPAAISGPSGVCITSTSTLTDATTGGTWTSSNTAVATVGSSSGIVSGLALGTAVITYSLGAGCTVTRNITVNALPGGITGSRVVCKGLTTTLFDGTAGGTWSSSVVGVATVGSSTGVVTGISAGTATITYTSAAGCIVTADVTVNPLASITGSLNVCVGMTTSLSNVNSGGSWFIAPSLAGVSSSGGVTGIGAGTAVVSYVLPTGCTATTVVTINSLPAAITGTTSVCVGSVTTLSDASPAGTWSTDNAAVGNAGSASGVIGGVAVGSVNITYTLPTGCIATTVVTVNPLPDTIMGSSNACATSPITLVDATPGGTWSSSNTAVAVVGSTTGIVTGAGPGIVNIIYTLPTTCSAVKTLTMYPLPASIIGTLSACVGSTTTLTDPTGGGTWSSSDPAVGTVSMTTGAVTGTSPGTLTITYTLPTGCYTTRTFTVNGLPDVISGPSSVCVASAITLANTVAGGSWSSGFSNVSVSSTTGGVIGISSGTAVITYSLSTGCFTSKTITVNSLPAAITGPSMVCVGSTIVLASATPGGTWSSSNTAAGTINATTGVLYGLGSGTTTVAYTLPTGCFSGTVVSVNSLPASISGSTSVCLGASITLTDATAGGSWVSSNAAFAVVGSSSGIVTGYTIGSATITYMMPAGCFVVSPMTINLLPLAISGPAAVCNGYSVLLNDATPGGSWSSSNTSVATVGSSSGVVAGVGTGPTVITYTLPTGCRTTKNFSVYPTPAAITGTTGLCVGSTTTLSDATGSGVWSVGTPSVATVGSTTGVVTALSPGTTLVSYTLGSCYAITTVTVSVSPPAISGTTGICQGTTTTLSNSAGGGSWVSSGSIVIVGSASGAVTGVGPGTTTISYILPTGCYVTSPFTVNALPAAITGPTSLCVGSSAFYTNSTTGGTWSSSNPSVAGINATGLGIAYTTGTTNISYTLGAGCATGITLTITLMPSPIVGPSTVCENTTISLSSASSGGTWSSSGPVAGINATTGVLTGFISGTAPVTYTLPSGCYRATTITVNALPAAIAGPASVCTGQTISLSDITPGGTWSSGTPGIATVNAGGTVAGASPGNATITYTSSAGCIATKAITVNPSPVAITGTAAICNGSITTLSNTTTGGTWSSGNTAVATISGTGIVAGILAGTSVMSYTLPSGCAAVITATVNPLPASILGPATVCSGSAISLTNASVGGSWTSSNVAAATVGASTGAVSGFAALPFAITYTLPTGCTVFKSMTVNPAPAPITGTAAACQGYTTTLADVTSAGTWSSVTPGIAGVSAVGVVTGMSDGIAMISYTLANGCAATLLYTVHPLAPITGSANACLGQTTNLNNLVAGGSWSSSNIAIATIGSATGALYGVALGTATVSYILPTGCMSVKNITVNPSPAAITGASSACTGATVTLSNTTPGGMWSSSATAIAPVSSTGVVNGLAPGSATIVYVLSTGCASYTTITINVLYPIGGSSNICASDTMTFTYAIPGGAWSSTSLGVATINSFTGLVTGIAPGTTIVRYLLSTGCLASMVVTVNGQPSVYAMTGGGSFCVGGPGVSMGLSSSSPAVDYKLFKGSSLVGSYLGTGSAISFGIFTVVGTYSVFATDNVSGCTRNMSGAAVVSLSPLNTPSVSVTTTSGGAICSGFPATFVSVASFPGSAPAYVWRVNGVITGSGASYTYVPASGDIVSCKMTSSATCLSTDTTSGFMTVSLTAPSIPAVSIASTPADTMCPLTTVTLTPTPVNGGSAPWYNWVVNGLSAGVSPTFSYAPLNGDNVYCVMHSNQYCITSDTVSSNHKVFTVYPATFPTVTITANPGLTIATGTSDTLTALVSGGGMAPTYQWLLNGIGISGATTATYVSASFANGDVVSCTVTNTDMCAGAPDTSKVILTVKTGNNNHVGIATTSGLISSLYLVPNPNTGIFTLQGSVEYEGEMSIEVTDLLGQTVYHAMLNSQGHQVNSRIALDSRLANGMYILNIYVAGERHALHFVIEK